VAFQIFAVLLIVVGMMLFLVAYRLKQVSRPGGHIDYADEHHQITILRGPLVDSGSGLAGIPDSILHILVANQTIPIIFMEGQPSDSIDHQTQMRAVLLCRLTENAYSQPAPYAILRYPDADVIFERTPDTETSFDTLIAEMRELAASENETPCPYDIPGPQTCEHCIL